MASELTAPVLGFSAHGSGMLNRRTVWVERGPNYTNKHGLTRLHARPTSNMLTYLQYLLNAQPIHLFSGFSYHVRQQAPSLTAIRHATNHQTIIHNIHNSDYK